MRIVKDERNAAGFGGISFEWEWVQGVTARAILTLPEGNTRNYQGVTCQVVWVDFLDSKMPQTKYNIYTGEVDIVLDRSGYIHALTSTHRRFRRTNSGGRWKNDYPTSVRQTEYIMMALEEMAALIPNKPDAYIFDLKRRHEQAKMLYDQRRTEFIVAEKQLTAVMDELTQRGATIT